MKLRKEILGLAVAAGISAIATDASAVLYGFSLITNNGNGNIGSQLSVDVTDAGGGKVDFKFLNNVGTASSITDVYFDDTNSGGIPATILSAITIQAESAGVDFSLNASPPDLPGGNAVNFDSDAAFSADSSPPVSANGVNSAAESLTVRFNANFAQVISQLNAGELRVGLHVQAIGTKGGSDSYVNNPNKPPTTVPEPASIALLGASLLGLAGLRRRKS